MKFSLGKLGPPEDMAKAPKGGLLDNALVGLLRAAGVDPAQVVEMIQGVFTAVTRNNELLADVAARLAELKPMQDEIELLQLTLRNTVPEANLVYHNRDMTIMEAMGMKPPEPPSPSNGAFRSYASLEEARAAVAAESDIH
jgi:hypothetical protein